jgi:hypothetical protein
MWLDIRMGAGVEVKFKSSPTSIIMIFLISNENDTLWAPTGNSASKVKHPLDETKHIKWGLCICMLSSEVWTGNWQAANLVMDESNQLTCAISYVYWMRNKTWNETHVSMLSGRGSNRQLTGCEAVSMGMDESNQLTCAIVSSASATIMSPEFVSRCGESGWGYLRWRGISQEFWCFWYLKFQPLKFLSTSLFRNWQCDF